MKPNQLTNVRLHDVISRKPGRLDPLTTDVGEVIIKKPHFFIVRWTNAAMPSETFFDNNDPFLKELRLHKPDFH